ncbi:hypothetical protein IFM89_016422 [Coptis chinensis]|uniref:Uncharacterized protein n=1 Tax=Coptis chinensis TaxID=261450 RepID=A0A835LRX8_9MAGN|nr:hypothetical protein IFM89_016422 [Coptis chinensis]
MASSFLRNTNSKRLLTSFYPIFQGRGSITSPIRHFSIDESTSPNNNSSNVQSWWKSFIPSFTGIFTNPLSILSSQSLSTSAANSELDNEASEATNSELESEEDKKKAKREVDVEVVKRFCSWFTRYSSPMGFQVSAVYYGVSVVHYLNDEVALKDAVRKAIIDDCASHNLKFVRLGGEPSVDWIVKDRTQLDEKAWDVVVSVCIDDLSEEDLQRIREKGVRNLIWLIICKEGLSKSHALCDGKFMTMIHPQSCFFKEVSD